MAEGSRVGAEECPFPLSREWAPTVYYFTHLGLKFQKSIENTQINGFYFHIFIPAFTVCAKVPCPEAFLHSTNTLTHFPIVCM